MRTGLLTYDFSPPIGGLGATVKMLVQELERQHPEETLFVLSPASDAPPLVPSITRLRWKKRGGCPFFSFVMYWRLPAIIKQLRLDVLHVQAGSGGVVILRKPTCPMIVTSHHTYQQEAEIVYRCQPLKRAWKNFMGKLERRTYLLADKVIAVSADTKHALVHDYGIHPDKIVVIENAVYFPSATEASVKKDGNTVLYIGRLEPRKGIWTLLSAVERLKRTHPNIRIKFIGQNLLGQSLHNFLHEKNLTDHVELLGFQPDDAMRRELKAATVLVVPSILEGFGLIAAEAMAAGTCVVASDCPGLKSVIKNRETGILFRTGSSANCSESIAEILDHPDLRMMIEKRALADADKRFRLPPQAKATRHLYLSLHA